MGFDADVALAALIEYGADIDAALRALLDPPQHPQPQPLRPQCPQCGEHFSGALALEAHAQCCQRQPAAVERPWSQTEASAQYDAAVQASLETAKEADEVQAALEAEELLARYGDCRKLMREEESSLSDEFKAILDAAMEMGCPVIIRYAGGTKAEHLRTITPLKWDSKKRRLRLLATCHRQDSVGQPPKFFLNHRIIELWDSHHAQEQLLALRCSLHTAGDAWEMQWKRRLWQMWRRGASNFRCLEIRIKLRACKVLLDALSMVRAQILNFKTTVLQAWLNNKTDDMMGKYSPPVGPSLSDWVVGNTAKQHKKKKKKGTAKQAKVHIQQEMKPGVDGLESLRVEAEASVPDDWQGEWDDLLQDLSDIGFEDIDLNKSAIAAHHGNLNKTVKFLVTCMRSN
jgi:hypothetical protein